MRLHPNPPRMVTVALAVGLAVFGVICAWPVDAGISLLAPLDTTLASVGLGLDPETGYLSLFAASALLVAGSLVPRL